MGKKLKKEKNNKETTVEKEENRIAGPLITYNHEENHYHYALEQSNTTNIHGDHNSNDNHMEQATPKKTDPTEEESKKKFKFSDVVSAVADWFTLLPLIKIVVFSILGLGGFTGIILFLHQFNSWVATTVNDEIVQSIETEVTTGVPPVEEKNTDLSSNNDTANMDDTTVAVLQRDEAMCDTNTPESSLNNNNDVAIASDEPDGSQNSLPAKTYWIDSLFIPTSVSASVIESEKVQAYIDFFNENIDQRKATISTDKKITPEYVDLILKATDEFAGYDENADWDINVKIVDDASGERELAKQECRQSSNEQNLANWYALCGKLSSNTSFQNKEFIYYNMAIDMYMDGYSVSLLDNRSVKVRALDYITTCYLNIYNNDEFPDEIKTEALYSAAAFDNMYIQSLKETDTDPSSLDKYEHGAHMDLGEIYIWLCKQAKPQDKFYYYQKATEELNICPQYAGFGDRMKKRIYKDFVYLTQYCYDNIKSDYYSDEVTKASLIEAHDFYESEIPDI